MSFLIRIKSQDILRKTRPVRYQLSSRLFVTRLTLPERTHISEAEHHRHEYISVSEFYKDRTVFLTGATGFVGQGLVEKILRSCPDVKKIVLPIRESRKGCVQQRFQDLIQQPVFGPIRSSNPNFADKLLPLSVDLSRQDLGLKPDLYSHLTDSISVVIHGAANTKLNGPLREMLTDNVQVTENIIKFSKTCPNLKTFVYVSTGFSHVHREVIKEIVYDNATERNLLEKSRQLLEGRIDSNENFDLEDSPVTYVFSKRMAELLIAMEHGHLPIVISRPCMITPSLKEPSPSWTFGVAAYNGVMMMISNHMLLYFPAHPDVEMELVPVDHVVNSIITSAWLIGTRQVLHPGQNEPLVIHTHSTNRNKITNKDFVNIVNDYYKNKEQTKYRLKICRSKLRFNLLSLFRRLPQCVIDDSLSLKNGRKPREVKLLFLQLKQIGMLSHSTYRNPRREYGNNLKLNSILSQEDQETFGADIKEVNWANYLQKWLESCGGR